MRQPSSRLDWDWHQYLLLAQHLAGQGGIQVSQEANQRASLSRAYYSIFHLARCFLRDHDHLAPPPPPFNTHEWVASQFIGSRDNRRRAIGANLHRLRTWRNEADYDDGISRLDYNVGLALVIAGDVLKTLDTI